MKNWTWNAEPVLIVRFIEALLLLLVALGAVVLAEPQIALIVVTATAFIEMAIGGKITREQVWSPEGHEKELEATGHRTASVVLDEEGYRKAKAVLDEPDPPDTTY